MCVCIGILFTQLDWSVLSRRIFSHTTSIHRIYVHVNYPLACVATWKRLPVSYLQNSTGRSLFRPRPFQSVVEICLLVSGGTTKRSFDMWSQSNCTIMDYY